jgi:hypothetical protein
MTLPTYAYFQIRPYHSRYRVARSWAAGYYRSEFVGEVERVTQSKWKATLYTDPTTEGFGRTRNLAMARVWELVGGEG